MPRRPGGPRDMRSYNSHYPQSANSLLTRRARRREASSDEAQRLVHILDQILRVLDADGKPQQAVAYAEPRAHLRRQPLMRRRCRMRDEALGIAQVVGNLDDLKSVGETERAFLAALDLDADHAAAQFHLAHGKLMLR